MTNVDLPQMEHIFSQPMVEQLEDRGHRAVPAARSRARASLPFAIRNARGLISEHFRELIPGADLL